MKMFKLLFFLLVVPVYAQNETEGSLVLLRAGEGFHIGSTAVKFKEVLSDSRCPENVTCIWAGEAKIALEITNCGETVTLKEIVISGTGIGFKSSPLNLIGEYFDVSISEIFLSPNVATASPSDKNYYLQFKLQNNK